jgi:F0F1-type ATP synthase membrane subunit b/b'
MTNSPDPAARNQRPTTGGAGRQGDAGDQRQQKASQAVDQVQQKASQAADQVQDKAGQVADQARQQATTQLASQKERATGGLGTVAHAMRETGDHLRDQDQDTIAGYADQAADQIERLADYLRHRNVNELIGDAQDFARRQPALFLTGAFALGVLGARFLKSSSPSQGTGSRYPDAPHSAPRYPTAAAGGWRTGYRSGSHMRPYGAPPFTAGRDWSGAGEPATAGPDAVTGGSAPLPTATDWERDATTSRQREGHDAGT